jgi:hypothetical protein
MRKSALLLALVAGVLAATPGRPAVEKRGGLERFGGCGAFLAYAKQQAAPLVGPYGLWTRGRAVVRPRAASPLPAGRDYSTTNVQEEGVDEPDIVKTDGMHLFTVTRRHVYAIAARGTPRRVDRLTLPGEWYGSDLLLHDTRLLVLAREGRGVGFRPGGVRSPTRYDSVTSLFEIDVSRPSSMRLVRTLTVQGAYVGARLVDGVIRLVSLSSVPDELAFQPPAGSDPAALEASTARNRELLAASTLPDWLPTYTVRHLRSGRTTKRALIQCRHMWRPAAFSGLALLSVLTVDLERGLEVIDSDAVLGDGEIVYASPTSLYVATERWTDRPSPDSPFTAPPAVRTAIHKFSAVGRSTQYRASGTVAGYLLNQWSLSEHEGVLRVASTEAPAWWWTTPPESASYVTTLVERDQRLVGLGRSDALGRGERIYAVRFAGDIGYVVTFRRVDPLYTLDLSEPTRPRVRGELKILGYSAYLHLVGEDLVLGVGQDATEQGVALGTQLSLFDVSNPAKPDRIHRRTIGRGSSLVEFDHYAFLYWPPERLTVVPVSIDSSGAGTFVGAIGFRHSRATGFEEIGRISHSDLVLRSVVVGDTLFTVSVYGVKANALRSFALRNWIEYPDE